MPSKNSEPTPSARATAPNIITTDQNVQPLSTGTFANSADRKMTLTTCISTVAAARIRKSAWYSSIDRKWAPSSRKYSRAVRMSSSVHGEPAQRGPPDQSGAEPQHEDPAELNTDKQQAFAYAEAAQEDERGRGGEPGERRPLRGGGQPVRQVDQWDQRAREQVHYGQARPLHAHEVLRPETGQRAHVHNQEFQGYEQQHAHREQGERRPGRGVHSPGQRQG